MAEPDKEKLLIEMCERLSDEFGDTDTLTLTEYLKTAAAYVMRRAYPFGCEIPAVVPPEYRQTQLEVARYLLNKRGAEGETAHSENGISRSYESGGVPDSLLWHIVPHASLL